MSLGSKSGVNCTRLNLHPNARANVFESRVFARPGKSSSNMFPLDSIPTVTLRRFSFLPMITFETSPMRELAIEDTVAMRSFVRWSPVGAPAWNPAFMVLTPLGTGNHPAPSILQGIAYISRRKL